MTAVDTNLLFAWLNRDHAWHAAAAAWMSSEAATTVSRNWRPPTSRTSRDLDSCACGIRWRRRESGYNGQLIDLDNGTVGAEGMGSGDLEWTGTGFGRHLRTRCGARLARTDSRDFASVLRWRLYPLSYTGADVPANELAIPLPFPDLPSLNIPQDRKYLETNLVYAVRTAEGRFSVIQVIEVFDGSIRVRYKTYEKRLPSVQVRGEFACDGWQLPEVVTDLKDVRFEALPRESLRFQRTGASTGLAATAASAAAPIPTAAANAAAVARLGRWRGTLVRRRSTTGHFRASVENFRGELRFHWHVAGVDLLEPQGDLTIDGHPATYEVDPADPSHLIVNLQSRTTVEFLVKATVNDPAGNALSASKCVRFTPFCTVDKNVIPSFELQIATFHEHFSVVRLPLVALGKN